MADELKRKVEIAIEDLKKAWEVAEAAAYKRLADNSSGDVAKAGDAAAAEVAAAMAKLKELEEAYQQEMAKGGRRKHKARGTKRRRHSGGFQVLDQLLAKLPPWLGGPPPPGASVAAAPVAAPPPGASASFGGKSGKKRKHSRRKY